MKSELMDWLVARRLLAVRLDNLGDVLMTTPALRALREGRPDRHITLLSSPVGAALLPFIPEIDATLVVESPWMPGAPMPPARFDDMVQQLRQADFDAAVIFTVYSQNPLPAAMLCWQAGIPLVLAHCRENPYHLLSDWVPDPEPHEMVRHEVRRQLDLVGQIGAYTRDEHLSFRLRPEDVQQAADQLGRLGIDPERHLLLLHPGATAASRRYPPEHFVELADQLAGQKSLQLVFTGDASEAGLIDSIRARLRHPIPTLAGHLNLGELAAVIAAADLLIANNSGPVHIAAAVGTPVVDLYALINPQHAPWRVASRVLYHDVPCRFCYRSICPQGHHDCLRRLAPERVARAAYELLECGADYALARN